MQIARCIFPTLTKSGLSQQIFTAFPKIQFHVNLSSGSRTDTRRRTAGHDEANRRFSRVCEHSSKRIRFAGKKITHWSSQPRCTLLSGRNLMFQCYLIFRETSMDWYYRKKKNLLARTEGRHQNSGKSVFEARFQSRIF
jgi:hypothetical protein